VKVRFMYSRAPGNTSTYSEGNTSTYSAGNTSTYSPGNTSTYSPGNTSTYSAESPVPTTPAVFYFDFSSAVAYNEEDNSVVPADATEKSAIIQLPPPTTNKREKLVFSASQGAAQIEIIQMEKKAAGVDTEASVVKVAAPSSASTSEQTQGAPVSSTNAATIAVLGSAAAASAAFALIMVRRNKGLVKDLKFAFDQPNTVAAENPLYEGQVQTVENPLFKMYQNTD
jgi:hypothetical protein